MQSRSLVNDARKSSTISERGSEVASGVHRRSAGSVVIKEMAECSVPASKSVSVDEAVELDRQSLENGVLEPLRELRLIDDEPTD